MKTLRNILGIHFTLLILCSVIFTLVIWAIAQLFPSAAEGFPIMKDGRIIGYENVGQKFTKDKYFQGRPSASDYNAAATSASNMGPTNPDYLKEVKARVDTFLVHNPGIKVSDIPVEMVTASGSGLDPHISPEGALIQVKRISRARDIPEYKIRELVEKYKEKPLLGLFGPERINVLRLNLALEKLEIK
ncbi:MAG: potassium-transporting ATPase subunit KdpC [Bacteroidota bacterium]|jgi:K+-transporting ATPase ATPase C chain|nr:potassium-transporting ATPase subunit KdpC [Ignavibacteria bacterium]MCU7497973.1 potassium-transporting ATPase subunit KdpC [Ignavibacteria bacterium]MCU7511741.1 potassium-transporting ATPase subunit KdpC [Ignavibacteria bacterium]MCU7519815.1 potassium-transporting ATPase subunit KdpC [Ignavibacteria bacterium]MCU7523687.1 potassium-transporting ATPase subunit KdpC [Ignavibacteria bacterium]